MDELLVYCIECTEEDLEGAAQIFREAIEGGHGAVILECLSILRNRFAGDEDIAGFRKKGSVAVARFESDESVEVDQREARVLRQLEANSVIEQFLGRIASEVSWR